MATLFFQRLAIVKGSGTQIELAAKLGITQSSTSALLRGETVPSYEVLQKLVEMGYNANWLLTGKGGMYISDEAATNVAPATMAVAEKLTRYPELASTLAEAIELREKLEGAKEELKAKLKYPKKR